MVCHPLEEKLPMKPHPLEITAFQPPSASKFSVTFGGGNIAIFWNDTIYFCLKRGLQMRQTGQYKAKVTFLPLLLVKPLITVITTIMAPLGPLSRKVYTLVGLQQQLYPVNCMTVCIKQQVCVQTLNNLKTPFCLVSSAH